MTLRFGHLRVLFRAAEPLPSSPQLHNAGRTGARSIAPTEKPNGGGGRRPGRTSTFALSLFFPRNTKISQYVDSKESDAKHPQPHPWWVTMDLDARMRHPVKIFHNFPKQITMSVFNVIHISYATLFPMICRMFHHDAVT